MIDPTTSSTLEPLNPRTLGPSLPCQAQHSCARHPRRERIEDARERATDAIQLPGSGFGKDERAEVQTESLGEREAEIIGLGMLDGEVGLLKERADFRFGVA